MLCEWRQARIGRGVDFLDRRRASCDQGRVDLVVLGPLQDELGIGPHLRGLEHNDHEAIAAQLRHHGLLIAAARLNADPFDALAPQPGRQTPVAVRSVVDLQLLRTLIERRIELAFAGIDAGADHVMLAHLRRPFLVMRTLGSFNHTGPDEEPIAILLRTSALAAAVGNDPTIGGPARAATRSRAVPCGTNAPYSFALIQGWAKARSNEHEPRHAEATAPCPRVVGPRKI